MADPWGPGTYTPLPAQQPADPWVAPGTTPPVASPIPTGQEILDGVGDAASAAWRGINTGVNYLGTQTAKLASGALGMPRAASDAMDYAAKKLKVSPLAFGPVGALTYTGRYAPSGDEIYKAFKEKTGAPEVNLEGHVPGGAILDAGVQGTIGTVLTGGTSLPSVLAGFGAGAGQEGAGQWAHDFDAQHGTHIEPFIRTVGGIFGALAGHGAGKTTQYGGKVAKSLISPLTAAGRDELVGRTLNKLADDPIAARTNMLNYAAGEEAFPSATPGFRLTAANASGDDALKSIQNTLSVPGSGFGALVNSNNSALSAALNRVMAGGDPKAFVAELAKQDTGAAMRAQAALDALPAGSDAATAGLAIQHALGERYSSLVSARSAAVDPLYKAARASSTPVNPWSLMSDTADLVAATKGDPNSIVQKVRSYLFKPDGTPDRSAAGMMATRDAISSMLDNPQLDKYSRSLLMTLKRGTEEALSVVPDERRARATFAQYSVPLEPFDANLGNKTTATVIKRDQFGKDFLLPPDNVPGMYFRPGDAGAASMREFIQAKAGDPTATEAMHSFIADKARNAPDLRAFLKQYGPAIDALNPSLGRQLQDAAATRSISNGLAKSPAAPFVNGDLDAAVRSTLGKPDSAQRLQALRMQVGGNPQAVAGMQKSILDDFVSKATSAVQEDAQGNRMLQAGGAARWLEANRESVQHVLTPDQMNVLDTVVRNLRGQAQTAVKTAGSDTGRNIATANIIDSLLTPALSGKEVPGLGALKKGLGLVYGSADQRTLARLVEVMQDPRAAAALMWKASPGNVRLAQPLLTSVGRGAALPAARVGQ